MSDEFQLQFASKSGHDHLYHYEPFRPEYLAAMLRDQRIHCSKPSNFNDPWDCKPWFDTSLADDASAFDQLLEPFHRVASVVFGPAYEQNKAQLLADPELRRTFIEGLSRETLNTFNNCRILCLTPCARNQLMWAHYADHHRGICLQFGIDNPLVKMAAKVHYAKEYPVWKPDIKWAHAQAIQMLLTKSDAWDYEKEFRIIGSPDWEADQFDYRVTDEDFFRLPPNSLKSIIAGCASAFEQIKKIVNDNAPGLPVKRAIRIPDKYELTIEG